MALFYWILDFPAYLPGQLRPQGVPLAFGELLALGGHKCSRLGMYAKGVELLRLDHFHELPGGQYPGAAEQAGRPGYFVL